MKDQDKLLSIKELAGALGRGRNFVGMMKVRGFQMPGGRATIREARAWLARNPAPYSRASLKPAA